VSSLLKGRHSGADWPIVLPHSVQSLISHFHLQHIDVLFSPLSGSKFEVLCWRWEIQNLGISHLCCTRHPLFLLFYTDLPCCSFSCSLSRRPATQDFAAVLLIVWMLVDIGLFAVVMTCFHWRFCCPSSPASSSLSWSSSSSSSSVAVVTSSHPTLMTSLVRAPSPAVVSMTLRCASANRAASCGLFWSYLQG